MYTRQQRSVFLFIVYTLTILTGANYPLSGVVTEKSSGRPLSDVNVILANTHLGAATDEKGVFLIEAVPQGKYSLQVSAIGYEEARLTVSVPQKEPLEIRLKETFFQMGSVVVTGTRTGKIHQNAPIATEVISRYEIDQSGALDLGELLDQRSGVSVSTSVEGGTIVNILGMDSKYVLILVDGQPVIGKFNNRNALDQISTAIIDKVEIIKGPSSSLYGSEAMGGVINVITRRKISTWPLSLKLRYTGSDRSFNPFVRDRGKYDLRLNYFNQWKAFDIQFDFDYLAANVDKTIQYIDIDRYDRISFGNTIDWQLSDRQKLKWNATRFLNQEASETILMNTDTKIVRNTNFLEYQVTPRSYWQIKSLFRWDRYQRDYTQNRPWGAMVKGEHTTENQQELEVNSLLTTAKSSLNMGAEYSRDQFFSDRVAGGQRSLPSLGIYGQIEYSLAPDVTLVSGLRWDDNEEIDPVVSPRIAAMMEFADRWKFRYSWGRGFRMPSFMDRYINWNHQQFGYEIIGNPNLKPETSRGTSVGFEYYHQGEYLVSVTLYRNLFRQMIVDYLISPGKFTYVNVDRVRYMGMEIQGRWYASRQWLASWGYNWAYNKNLTTGKLVANHPVHTVHLRGSYKSPDGRFSSALKLKFVGPYLVDEFVVATQTMETNKRQAYFFIDVDSKFKITKDLTFVLGVLNLLNKTDQQYGPFIGRQFYIELTSNLKGK
ncbi:MAG: TonB-dependent receptor domain-containing protein [Fidelibacterota bacterium]